MNASKMTRLCQSIQARNAPYDRNGDLPQPNIYLCSVFRFCGASHNVYVAAQFTGSAMQKIVNWAVHTHGFRPMRSNSTIKVRRLLLGDIIENPAAYDAALELAKANGESDIVAGLRALPDWIAAQTGVPMPTLDDKGASSLWSTLSDMLSSPRILR